MPVQFESDSLPAASQLSAWRRALDCCVCVSERTFEADHAFPARLASRPFGNMTFLELTMPPMQGARGHHDSEDKDSNALFVSLMVSGRARLEIGSRQAEQRTGDVLVWGGGMPHRWTSREPMQSVCLKVPLPHTQMSRLSDLTARPLDGATPIGSLVGGMLRQLAGLAVSADAPQAYRLGSAFMDTLSASLELEYPSLRLKGSGRTLGDAKHYVLSRLSDSSLDADKIASGLCMSPRTLQRLFAASGTTLSRWMLGQRLDMARRLLTEGSVLRVSDAALASGFSSFSHFTHVFKAEFGMAPRLALASRFTEKAAGAKVRSDVRDKQA